MLYTPPPLSKKTKIIIILLILLLHLLLLVPILTTKFNFSSPSKLEQKVQELHKKVHKIKEDEPEEWAALNSRAMQMSAPVILVNDADADASKPDPNEQAQAENLTDDSQKEDKRDTDAPHQEIEETASQPVHIDIPKEESTYQIPENKTLESKLPTSEKPNAQPSAIDKITQPSPAAMASKQKTPAKPNTQAQRKKASTQKNTMAGKQLSLAQLAQGFVDHMKHEGDYTISMSGNASAKATESQLKVGRFLQRIIGAIQNSWRANTNRYPLSQPVIASIHFTIVINKNGTLNTVIIDKSTGNYSLDNYIKLIIQDASSSFSSIPDYMGHDVCSIRCALDDIRLPEGPPGYTIRQ